MYDEYHDCIPCPQDKVLSYATTNREGYRECKRKGYICQGSPGRESCTQNQEHTILQQEVSFFIVRFIGYSPTLQRGCFDRLCLRVQAPHPPGKAGRYEFPLEGLRALQRKSKSSFTRLPESC